MFPDILESLFEDNDTNEVPAKRSRSDPASSSSSSACFPSACSIGELAGDDCADLEKLFHLKSSQSESASTNGDATTTSDPNGDAVLAKMPAKELAGLEDQTPDAIKYPESLEPEIQNILCCFCLGTDINLQTLNFRLRNSEYNPKKINALLLRMRVPKVTAMIYQGGKVSVSGAQSMEDALYASKKVAKTIQKAGYPDAVFSNFKVENIIARADCGFPVRLEMFAFEQRKAATYEPELFAGCTYRMTEPKCSVLVFVTGKLVINGNRTLEDLYAATRNIYEVCVRYQS